MGLFGVVQKVFGTKNEREVKKLRPLVTRVNSFESDMKVLKDADFPTQANLFRGRAEKGESLDKMLPEMYALVREASIRTTGMRPYDVQLVGGIALHQGKIAEMKTGEGKTLVATLPLCLNAISGKGAHLVTVNDYLAKRDAEWMAKIYRFLGLTVGVISHDITDSQRKENYNCDITYGTNNEFGFDYLRDNMKFNLEDYAQRDLNFAIIDEVDSILVDEARTPLIISGPSDESTDLYYHINAIIPKLQRGLHFTIEDKSRTVVLTDEGVELVERLLQIKNLYDLENIATLHHVNQALRAHAIYKRDIDYMVKGGQVMIIDEFTGRALPGRRWSDGLHQAVEAKEKVKIEGENETLATISFQNYFRLYSKLSGMTGTAETEAAEFHKTYKMDVMVIPTNKPIARADYQDVVYRTEREKYEAVIESVKEAREDGQPSLVGTISIEKSEILHKMLTRQKIPHQVLNARHDISEADVVSQAGRVGAVTIATNMAGRGTDIILGGNPEPFIEAILEKHGVDPKSMESTIFIKESLKGDEKKVRKLGAALTSLSEGEYQSIFENRDKWSIEAAEVLKAGGLNIIGTERHDSRRIDNQLRGRAGRQGDPGSSRFFLSLEDDLMKRFGSERLGSIMQQLGMEYGEPIEHKMVSRAIENAQKKVEAHNFEIRKHLLEYDDVMDIQRKTIYKLRRELLSTDDVRERIMDLTEEVLISSVEKFCPDKVPLEQWDLEGLELLIFKIFHIEESIDDDVLYDSNTPIDALLDMLWEQVDKAYTTKEGIFGAATMRSVERELYLMELDDQWKGHLNAIEDLREGIGLQGYRQVDPKMVYKKEAYNLFQSLLVRIKSNLVEKLFHLQAYTDHEENEIFERRQERTDLHMHHGAADEESEEPAKPSTVKNERAKLGRNSPCHCGSGKKYKNCHYRKDSRK